MNYTDSDARTAYASPYDPRDIERNRTLALLSYIGPLFLLPMLLAPRSRFARFHANQGLVLFLVWALYNVFTRILVKLLELIFGFLPILPGIVSFIFGFLGLFFVALMVLGIANAANGTAKKLPIIGYFKLYK